MRGEKRPPPKIDVAKKFNNPIYVIEYHVKKMMKLRIRTIKVMNGTAAIGASGAIHFTMAAIGTINSTMAARGATKLKSAASGANKFMMVCQWCNKLYDSRERFNKIEVCG